ncbi:tryptophan synthase beta subunit-like PLP-dependent enzyme [Jimgerdemannia flammicorona]|uniref:L-serine ammonia-lyase n=1 Tax=Jimgerdemannia flammicorona TaxID=994334 RepID=A0A433QCG7_9FUNG|nr:tryptophan synthase beta subunit-like PLP-dependent enzyme [Jimgerdemannia flammicorona]
MSTPLHVDTPLLHSAPLTRKIGSNVWLKLENLQPTGSFKIRGIGHLCSKAVEAQGSDVHFICSSGGNAGLAVAYAGRQLDIPVTIVVPKTTTEPMRERIELEGADVVIHGDVGTWCLIAINDRCGTKPILLPESWSGQPRRRTSLSIYALFLLSTRTVPFKFINLSWYTSVYVPPFDHHDIWDGHASMIHEIKQQLDDNPPDAVICVVGGGGLLNGVIMGLQDHCFMHIIIKFCPRYNSRAFLSFLNSYPILIPFDSLPPVVPVIAVETHGSNSFQSSVVAGKLVTLDCISTIATSLGARTVSAKSLELSLVHPVVPFAVSDAMAADAVCSFADDHRFLVESACGAGLSVCYTGVLRDILPQLHEHSNVVVIVCGGSNVSVDVVASYRKRYANPPIIVRSGSEVFLKLGDGGLSSMDMNLGEMGATIATTSPGTPTATRTTAIMTTSPGTPTATLATATLAITTATTSFVNDKGVEVEAAAEVAAVAATVAIDIQVEGTEGTNVVGTNVEGNVEGTNVEGTNVVGTNVEGTNVVEMNVIGANVVGTSAEAEIGEKDGREERTEDKVDVKMEEQT